MSTEQDPAKRRRRIRKIVSSVAEPTDAPCGALEAIAVFERAGWREDAHWLAPLVLDVVTQGTVPDTLTDLQARRLGVVARCADSAVPLDRDSRLLRAFVQLCDPAGDGEAFYVSVRVDPALTDRVELTPALRERIAATFRENGSGPASFAAALVRTGWPGTHADAHKVGWAVKCQTDAHETLRRGEQPSLFATIALLTDVAGVDLGAVVDSGSLQASAVERWPADFDAAQAPVELDVASAPLDSPRRFEPWLLALGPAALLPMLAAAERERDDAAFAAVALGVRCALERWLAIGGHHPTHFEAAGAKLGAPATKWFDALHARATRDGAAPGPALRRAWLWFAQCAFTASGPPEQREVDPAHASPMRRVLQAATDELTTLRKLLRRTGSSLTDDAAAAHAPAAEFRSREDHLAVCVGLLFRFGGIWRGLKPMLLAWRELATPAVCPDLRYWPEPAAETQPPQPWCKLVAWPINLFHHHARHEQATDENLASLRGELARFCLERLRDRLTPEQRSAKVLPDDEAMIERSPEWRYCLVRAVAGLGIDPDGRGHRTLHVCAERDPDDEVRDAARDAYQRMRRGVGLPADVSPRRAILSALWWMRQAHLLALEVPVDRDGAQRTRIKELTRTKERERSEARDRPSTD